MKMHTFKAEIAIIGVNPYVTVPDEILAAVFAKANKSKSPVPVHGHINDAPYTQTLVRYANEWRLYINTKMLKNSPKRIGETVEISNDYDPRDRTLPLYPELEKALNEDARARQVFE